MSFKVEPIARLVLNFLFEIVGERKTGLSGKGSCFPHRHFLPILSNLFMFSFVFVLVYFVNGKTTKYFVIFIFTPVNRLGSFQGTGIVFAAPKVKSVYLRGVHLPGNFCS